MKDVTLYVGKSRIRIDETGIGSSQFMNDAEKGYRKQHGGMSIPKRNPCKDLFHNHVDNPGEFIFVYILIYVIIIGTVIIVSFNTKAGDGAWFVYVTLGIFFVLWSAFVVASVVIGRNPKKYSKRLIRFFFKDGYTH